MIKKLSRIFASLILLSGLSLPAIAADTTTKSLVLTVNAGTLVFTTTSLAEGEVGLAYTGVSVAVSGGVAPYTFSVTSGSLPAGLSLSSAGAFSGTPTTAGTSTFTITATDSESPAATVSQSFSIVVISVLTITTTSLPSGTVGSTYSAILAATGGVTPYTWSITSGALPAGITLTASTGVISGTPTASGNFDFTVQVADSSTSTPATVRVTGSTLKSNVKPITKPPARP